MRLLCGQEHHCWPAQGEPVRKQVGEGFSGRLSRGVADARGSILSFPGAMVGADRRSAATRVRDTTGEGNLPARAFVLLCCDAVVLTQSVERPDGAVCCSTRRRRSRRSPAKLWLELLANAGADLAVRWCQGKGKSNDVNPITIGKLIPQIYEVRPA